MTTPATHPIFLATVSAPTNIAVVKYWGKADEHYNTPINSSCSVTLHQDDLRAVTTVAVSKDFVQDRLWLNGVEVPTAATSRRFRACVDGVLALAPDKYHTDDDNNNKTVVIAQHEWPTLHVHVSSYNTFPTAAGLASSAAGYAALVAALVQLTGATETFPGEFSTLARQGSGSACRSLYGGLVAWHAGTADEQWRDSRAEQLADEASWPALRAVIAVVSDAQKDTASTAGMQASVKTSPLLAFRAAHVVPQRMQELTQAWRRRDFPVFGKITMQDSNQFHATCLDTYPPIFYMNDVSRQIIRIVTAYNDYAGEIRAAYTLDAGPNVVLYVLEPHRPVLAALLRHFFPASGLEEQNDEVLDPALVHAAEATGRIPRDGDVRHYYVTRPGPGPRVLDNDADGTIDPHTGLNRYQPSG